MTFYAITITTDATITEHQWTPTDEASTLAHLQRACGGLVDVLALAEGVDMWIPDEGLYDGSKPNAVATAIAATYGFTHQDYHGTAAFTGGPDPVGATLALDPERGTHLITLARRLQEHGHQPERHQQQGPGHQHQQQAGGCWWPVDGGHRQDEPHHRAPVGQEVRAQMTTTASQPGPNASVATTGPHQGGRA